MNATLPLAPSSRDSGVVTWVVALGLLAAYLLVHAQALASLVGMWERNPMYSYGYLVAPISAFMIWSRRDALARIAPRPAIVGGLVVLAAWLALMIVGRMGSVILFEQLALLVAVVGLTLLAFGWRTLAAVWVPLAYLLLMIPFWDVLTEPLHVPFQNVSANIGVRMLQVIGIPAHREGTFITLPSIRLEVARACSGVNYLVAVIALGIPLGYLYLRSAWRRTVLVASGLIIAAFSNALRVALIGLLVTVDPSTPLHGPGHVLHGLFVAGIGHVTLFVALWLLGRAEAASGEPGNGPPTSTSVPGVSWIQGAVGGAAVGGVVFLLTATFLQMRVVATVPLETGLDALPQQLGRWSADPFLQPAWPGWWPATDTGVRRRYHADGFRADIYVGYVEAQQHARELVTPRAEPLHRAARVVTIASADGRPIAANRVETGARRDRRLTLFWYEVNGRTVASQSAVKLQTMWNAVAHRRTAGAVMAIVMEVPGGADLERVRVAQDELAAALDRGLRACLPNPVGGGTTAVARREIGV